MVEVTVAPEDEKEHLWQLFLDYARELTEYDGESRPRTVRHYACFDNYWKASNLTPFIVINDHEPAGFCLIQDTGVCYLIDEFYIRPLDRRRGFGKTAVEYIKAHCKQLGRHKTLEADIYINNAPAVTFWKSVGFKDTGRRIRIKSLRLMETEIDLDGA